MPLPVTARSLGVSVASKDRITRSCADLVMESFDIDQRSIQIKLVIVGLGDTVRLKGKPPSALRVVVA